jgi:hypothetical protein
MLSIGGGLVRIRLRCRAGRIRSYCLTMTRCILMSGLTISMEIDMGRSRPGEKCTDIIL